MRYHQGWEEKKKLSAQLHSSFMDPVAKCGAMAFPNTEMFPSTYWPADKKYTESSMRPIGFPCHVSVASQVSGVGVGAAAL